MDDLSFRRPRFDLVLGRLRERRRFIQVLAGPRQTGKTTLARQAMEAAGFPAHYASADEPTLQDRAWLSAQWDVGRVRALMQKHRSLPMDLPDATLVRVAEREGIRRVFTLDRRDFSVYSLGPRGGAFSIVP